MTRFFKIRVGYGDSEFVPIDENELQSALYVFMTDSKGVFKNGVVRGKDIIGISEDWHREMGWNYTHKLGPDDYAELTERGIKAKYAGLIGDAKATVMELIEKKQEHLIGKVPSAPVVSEVSDYTKKLSDKFRLQ